MDVIKLSYELWFYLRQFRTCQDNELKKHKIKFDIEGGEYLIRRKYYFKLIKLTDKMYEECVRGNLQSISEYQKLKASFISMVTLYNNSDFRFY